MQTIIAKYRLCMRGMVCADMW